MMLFVAMIYILCHSLSTKGLRRRPDLDVALIHITAEWVIVYFNFVFDVSYWNNSALYV